MAGLRFRITELVLEARALKTMGRKFLDSGSVWVLDRFSSDLESVRGAAEHHPCRLELGSLLTTPSTSYEPCNRHGGQRVHAAISGIWDVRPRGNRGNRKREIEFCGKASTKIELYASEPQPATLLSMWRMELGAYDSPGCYVHAQILGDADEPPFPRSVPIPRFPSIFVTPMTAVEFTLGELFQDEWRRRRLEIPVTRRIGVRARNISWIVFSRGTEAS